MPGRLPILAFFAIVVIIGLWTIMPGNLAAQGPILPPVSVVSDATFAAGTNAVAPGTIVAVFGTNLDNGSLNPTSSYGANGNLVTTLGGATVTFNGVPAPIFAAIPGNST